MRAICSSVKSLVLMVGLFGRALAPPRITSIAAAGLHNAHPGVPENTELPSQQTARVLTGARENTKSGLLDIPSAHQCPIVKS